MILPIDPLLQPLRVGSFFFQNMVKLKGIANEATYKHIFCPYTHSRPLGWDQRSKLMFFLKEVMLHIKLIGMEYRATYMHYVLKHNHDTWVESKVKAFSSESCNDAYQIKGNDL